MSIFSSFRISGSALTAQRLRMDVISSNIANAETIKTPDGGPYQRKLVRFAPIPVRSTARGDSTTGPTSAGVVVTSIFADGKPPRDVFDPGNPDANAEGYIQFPNIDLITEMTDMMSATRSYEANIAAINAAKAMAQRAIDIGRA